MKLHAHGIRIELPRRWEGKIYERDGVATLHGANFPLPHGDGDYATNALSTMPAHGALLVVTEFDQRSASKGLFDHQQPRKVQGRDFSPRSMQRTVAGRTGVQRFFTTHGRALCLYCVLSTQKDSHLNLQHLNDALQTLHIEPRQR
ncbi:MAG: hypothetical protein M3290_02735 [Actinomycetota bacterium]|nr:hypothetical protein [Actinomycetota bacterium]